MDQWRERLPMRTENFNVRLTSHNFEKERVDSLYEIDIQSSIDFKEKETKGLDKMTLEGSLTSPLSRFSKEKNEKNLERRQLLGNTFEKAVNIQTFKPEEEKNPQKMNANTDRNYNDKEAFQKPNKENQSPDLEAAEKFKEYIKRHLIENFISKNNLSMKSIFQNISNDVDKYNQLHFHHHEHHHHYHFDDSPMNCGESQYYEANKSEKRSNKNEDASDDKKGQKKPTKAYYFNCPAKSTQSYTKVDGTLEKNNAFCWPKSDKASTLETELKSETPNVKVPNSMETILYKTSDFVATHFFDDHETKKHNGSENNGEKSEKEKSVLDESCRKDSFEANLKLITRDGDVQVNPLIQEPNKTWGEDVKEELSNIKKELQRLEERHLMKRLKKKTDNVNKISVYSNKTFIVGNEKLFLKKNRRNENLLEKSDESGVTEKYFFVKSENFSGEEKDLVRRKYATRQQHLYSRGVYMIPN